MLIKILLITLSIFGLLVALFVVYSLFFYKVMTDESFDDREHF